MKFDAKRGLVERTTNKLYDGREPYIVLSLDGKARPEWEGFSPTAASATLLGKFLDVKDGAETVLDSFVDAMKLFNDSKYRALADQARSKLAQITDANAPEAQELKSRYQALIANILTDTMKPPPLTDRASR